MLKAMTISKELQGPDYQEPLDIREIEGKMYIGLDTVLEMLKGFSAMPDICKGANQAMQNLETALRKESV